MTWTDLLMGNNQKLAGYFLNILKHIQEHSSKDDSELEIQGENAKKDTKSPEADFSLKMSTLQDGRSVDDLTVCRLVRLTEDPK